MILAGTGLAATLLGGWIGGRTAAPDGVGLCLADGGIDGRRGAGLLFCGDGGAGTFQRRWARLALSMFLLFLPTGPITTEMFEIVPVHLRASAVALCTFFIHLFGDLGSPAAVGHISEHFNSLRTGVLMLPAVLVIGAVLWAAMLVGPQKEHA